jgi:hypothetical protein
MNSAFLVYSALGTRTKSCVSLLRARTISLSQTIRAANLSLVRVNQEGNFFGMSANAGVTNGMKDGTSSERPTQH